MSKPSLTFSQSESDIELLESDFEQTIEIKQETPFEYNEMLIKTLKKEDISVMELMEFGKKKINSKTKEKLIMEMGNLYIHFYHKYHKLISSIDFDKHNETSLTLIETLKKKYDMTIPMLILRLIMIYSGDDSNMLIMLNSYKQGGVNNRYLVSKYHCMMEIIRKKKILNTMKLKMSTWNKITCYDITLEKMREYINMSNMAIKYEQNKIYMIKIYEKLPTLTKIFVSFKKKECENEIINEIMRFKETCDYYASEYVYMYHYKINYLEELYESENLILSFNLVVKTPKIYIFGHKGSKLPDIEKFTNEHIYFW